MAETTESEARTDASAEEQARLRGFAAMSAERRRALGAKGGKTAHERGTANKFSPESASAAGRVAHAKGTAYRWNSEQARAAGRKGGSTPRKRPSGDTSEN